MTEVVAKHEAAGQGPRRTDLRILHGACVNLKDDACVTEQFEKLVTHYPKPEYWQDLINTLLRDEHHGQADPQRLAPGDACRRAFETPAQYSEMAQLAIAQGLPGEAQSHHREGLPRRRLQGRPQEKERRESPARGSQAAAALDKTTLAKQDESARAKPTGDADVKLGAAYLSYGEATKAIEALQRGIGKGGVKNPDEAGLLLGIAHMRADNKPEAAKAFRTVTKDPTMARIAKLWLLNT